MSDTLLWHDSDGGFPVYGPADPAARARLAREWERDVAARAATGPLALASFMLIPVANGTEEESCTLNRASEASA